jgi:hypothetical protein
MLTSRGIAIMKNPIPVAADVSTADSAIAADEWDAVHDDTPQPLSQREEDDRYIAWLESRVSDLERQVSALDTRLGGIELFSSQHEC